MAGDNDKTKKGFSGLLTLASEMGEIKSAIEPERPCDLKQLDDYVTNSIGMKLKLIPAGKFTMGDGSEAHPVTLTMPFYLGIYAVTQEEYQRVMGINPSKFKGARNPVENVSWDDAVEFCRKLSAMPEEKKAGRVYRLPTEAEWEYACRAGSETAYSFGNDEELGEYAWYEGNSAERPHPVGQKKPNAWGLYDMHGNVWEWCNDRYGDYPKGAASDPTGANEGSDRVIRGGCWYNKAAGGCRSVRRDLYAPGNTYNSLGFRVALSFPEIPK